MQVSNCSHQISIPADGIILSHLVTQHSATHSLGRQCIELETSHLKDEHLNHQTTDLAKFTEERYIYILHYNLFEADVVKLFIHRVNLFIISIQIRSSNDKSQGQIQHQAGRGVTPEPTTGFGQGGGILCQTERVKSKKKKTHPYLCKNDPKVWTNGGGINPPEPPLVRCWVRKHSSKTHLAASRQDACISAYYNAIYSSKIISCQLSSAKSTAKST